MTKQHVLKEENQQLFVKLTPDEFVNRSHKLAEAITERGVLELRHKAMKDTMKNEVSRQESEIGNFTIIVSRGEELRPVMCKHFLDTENMKVTEVRQDTGEVINERNASAHAEHLACELILTE